MVLTLFPSTLTLKRENKGACGVREEGVLVKEAFLLRQRCGDGGVVVSVMESSSEIMLALWHAQQVNVFFCRILLLPWQQGLEVGVWGVRGSIERGGVLSRVKVGRRGASPPSPPPPLAAQIIGGLGKACWVLGDGG